MASPANQPILTAIQELIQYYDDVGEDHRKRTFQQLYRYINASSIPITRGNQLRARGLGVKSKQFVDEFTQTQGRPARLLAIRSSNEPEVIKLFRSVFDIGQVSAKRLYDQGYRTLEDLQRATLTRNQGIGLKYHAQIIQRIPRAEMDLYREYVVDRLGPTSILVGSYRRGAAESRDIDILVRSLPITEAVKLIQPIIVETLGEGLRKFMGLVQLPGQSVVRRLDIRTFQPSEYAYGLLYNTGPFEFNVLCRRRARARSQSERVQFDRTRLPSSDRHSGCNREFSLRGARDSLHRSPAARSVHPHPAVVPVSAESSSIASPISPPRQHRPVNDSTELPTIVPVSVLGGRVPRTNRTLAQ